MAGRNDNDPIEDEKEIARMKKIFTAASIAVAALLASIPKRKLTRDQFMRQLDGILRVTQGQINGTIMITVPIIYTQGINRVDRFAAENRIAIKRYPPPLHRLAVKDLAESIQANFAEGIRGVRRNSMLVFDEALQVRIRQEIARKNIEGSTLKQAQNAIKGILKDRGVVSLVDRGGKTWQLDTYAEMLARTKSTEIHNTAVANRSVEYGFDLVQVSAFGTACAECAVWEGKVLSLTGASPGVPTVQEAESEGLFHPNCKHTYDTITEEEAQEEGLLPKE